MTRRLIVLLTMLLTLAGCSGVPESSDPVVVGPPPSGGEDTDSVGGIQPGGPELDASSDEIVRGFIRALTATDTSYSAAREFLTPEVRKTWAPSDEVTIIDPSNVATPASETTVRFTANRVAKVDAKGVYKLDSGGIDYEFELAKVNDQWRITNPPNELIIDSHSFDSLYRDASVYFADPSGTHLVPDLRYFRISPQQRANRLVQALIDGPAPALADGVRNELGDGVKLRSAVDFQKTPLTVDLSGLAGKTEAQQRLASAQILYTLADLGTKSARVTNDGEPLELGGVGDVQSTSDWEDYDPGYYPFNAGAYYLQGGAVLTESTAKVPGPVGTGEYGITDAAVSLDGTRIAVVSAGTSPPVLRTGGINELLSVIDLPGTVKLSAPTWGPSSDELWIVRNETEILRVSAKGGQPRAVSTANVGDIGPIRRIALSRDGVRLAIIAGAPGGPGRLYLATVQVSADAVTLLPAQPLVEDLDVSAVVWKDHRSLALLGKPDPTSSVFPYTVLVDDSQRYRLPPPILSGQTQAIAAAPGRPLLCSINEQVLKLQENAWVSLISGIAVTGVKPFYPG